MFKVFFSLLLISLSFSSLAADTMTIVQAESDFDTVKEDLEMAITTKGYTINGTLHMSDMLDRTGKDVGFPNPIYKRAESVEFCSAVLSHKMVQAHPANFTHCPLTIAIYTTVAEPEQVYLAFRHPMFLGDEKGELTKKVTAIFAELVEAASEF